MPAPYYPDHYRQPSDTIHLKPMLASESASIRSVSSAGEYYEVPPVADKLYRVETADARLKHRIRILKVVSRALAAIISAITLVPLTMTIIKFAQTKDVYYTVNGEQRTAWAIDTITWYTFMYFSIAAVSFILNIAILLSYCKGVKHANRAASVSGVFSALVLITHVVVWIISTALYRYGKEPVNGKERDLWGWTCSDVAAKLQGELMAVNFNTYCNVQVC